MRSVVAWIFFLASTSFGQHSNFRTYAHDQGLTDLDIVCLLQDRTGFLWVGTANGLFRYDGNRFQRFGQEAGLPVAAILTLAESIDGDLWVGTLAGISRRVGDRFENPDQTGLNPTQGAQTLTPNRKGAGVYAATPRGIVSLAPGRGAVSLPGAEGRPAWSVLSDARDSLWYGQAGEVCHWNGKQARCFGKNDGVPPDTWGGLAIDGGGTVWARSAARLIALSKGSERFEDKTAGLAATLRNGLLSVDQSGKVMVPTDAGMAQQIAGAWSLIDRSDGLPVSAVTTALEDREGSLWIGLRGGGLARRLGSEEWESWTRAEGLENDQIWAITRDQGGNLLVGTGAGLYRLADGKIKSLDELRFNSSSNRIRALATDTSGSVWLGTSPGGLARRDIKTGSVTRFEDSWEGIRVQRVLAVAVDRNHNVWAAGTSVFRFTQSGTEWSRHQEQIPGTGQSEIFSDVREDRAGRIWVAGDEGLAVWDGHSWTRLRPPLINLPRGAQHLAVSPDGSLWASFRDTARVTQIVRANGQWVVRSRAPGDERTDSDRNTFLGFDKLGRLWRGTGAGVFVLSGNHWIHYGSADGLAWDDTSSNAFFSDSDGSVWIGTSRGLSHHRESSRGGSLQASLRPPMPVIVNVRSGENNLGTTQPLRISYSAGNVTVQYSTPTFRDQRNVRFRYRLKGWHDVWIETQEAEARFGGMSPGNYVFEVNTGVWGEKWGTSVASLPVIIDGPFWMRRGFWIGLAALSGILLIVTWRLREMLHQQREKNLGVAVNERTSVIDKQRLREQARNHILEMLLGNQPLNTVFEHALGLMLTEAPGTICAVLIKQGDKCQVASQLLLPAGWQAALEISRAVPFEVWQKNRDWQNPSSDPAWKLFNSHISGAGPTQWDSMPVISNGSTVGALLYCRPTESTIGFDESSLAARKHMAEVVTQIIRLALDHNRLYEDLKFQIGHDPLTGLGNRVLWGERLAAALDEAQVTQQKVAILYLDLDRFKEVNDTLNHRAGDIYLHEVAQRMKTAVRPADFVSRIGGDEFTVLVPNIQSVEEAIAVGERILGDMKVPLRISGLELEPGASVGVAIYPDDAVDGTQLQRFADSAMYRAKQSGGGRVCAFSTQNNSLDESRLDDELRTALREGFFVVHYQAKVSKDDQLAGFEALLRLNHPKFGMIPPLDFIPAAERTGLIMPIGAWVLDEVCRQISAWRSEGWGEIAVAVNVSSVQLSQPDFADSVIACLLRHEVAPWHLELELTESILISGSESVLRQMRQLRALGVRLSIDDFGTGYSSLSYLYRLEVDTVKLDKSFIQPMENDKMARWLVHSMIGIAHGLGLGVVAEGVETEGQRAALIEAGCVQMQGYLFARPLAAADLEPLLRESSPGDAARSVDNGVRRFGRNEGDNKTIEAGTASDIKKPGIHLEDSVTGSATNDALVLQ